jgi:hypothetical protein
MTFLLLTLLLASGLQEAKAPVSANVWQGKVDQYEEELKTMKVVRMVDIGTGVTHPRRAYGEPGGLIESFAWKKLEPSRQNGYWESYRSEIAAYELDKLLEMNMIPPTVERKVNGERGAAIMWLKGMHSWEEAQTLPKPASWVGDLVRMKMFDCFIGNPDRNKGNMLADAGMRLFLIDHSRAFVDDTKLVAPFEHVDPELWKRMQALDEEMLKAKLGTWMERGMIKSMLVRRQKMETLVDSLVKKLGPAAYVR